MKKGFEVTRPSQINMKSRMNKRATIENIYINHHKLQRDMNFQVYA